MHALGLILKPTPAGWAVQLTDGRELARFRGPAARWRALRYLTSSAKAATDVSSARRTGPNARHRGHRNKRD